MEQKGNIFARPTFYFLGGKWKFDRTIHGHGAMTGEAVFTDTAPDTLSYAENGIHILKDGITLDFYRSYFYRCDGNILRVHFNDNRPFHDLEFRQDGNNLTATAHHFCEPDTYKGVYSFHGANDFSLIWDVRGPKKNYVIETHYLRQATC